MKKKRHWTPCCSAPFDGVVVYLTDKDAKDFRANQGELLVLLAPLSKEESISVDLNEIQLFAQSVREGFQG